MYNQGSEEMWKWLKYNEETGENEFLPNTPERIKKEYQKWCEEWNDVKIVEEQK